MYLKSEITVEYMVGYSNYLSHAKNLILLFDFTFRVRSIINLFYFFLIVYDMLKLLDPVGLRTYGQSKFKRCLSTRMEWIYYNIHSYINLPLVLY